MKSEVEAVIEAINDSDAEKRIAAEQSLLNAAKNLASGNANCSEDEGKVLFGLCEKTIEISGISRSILSVLPQLQTKSACVGIHAKRKGFNLSTNLSIITGIVAVVGMFGKFAGWW